MNKIKTLILILAVVIGLNVYSEPISTKTVVTQTSVQQHQSYTNPLDIVARPNTYLNKTVKIKAKFDKFATLGLDYKPAMRSSENYISFLIQRPDVTNHNIPLSELKIFLDRTEAEKYIELNSGDVVEFTGKVFATALGDPWMDATNFKVISTKSKTETK
jgi:hypothetical protein